jgi:hypothetical protein
MNASVLRRPYGRLTIGGIMWAVAVAAALLAPPPALALVIAVLSIPFLAMIAGRWLASKEFRRLAGFGFGSLALLTNGISVVSCVAPTPTSYGRALVILVLGAVPTTVAIGRGWLLILTRDEGIPPQSQEAASYLVYGSAALPFLTLWTLWRLYLAFLASRPALETMADQVSAGQAVVLPQWAGVFRVVGTRVEPISNYPGFMTDSRWGRTGFVRIPSGVTRNTRGPIVGAAFDVYLGDGWWYRG